MNVSQSRTFKSVHVRCKSETSSSYLARKLRNLSQKGCSLIQLTKTQKMLYLALFNIKKNVNESFMSTQPNHVITVDRKLELL